MSKHPGGTRIIYSGSDDKEESMAREIRKRKIKTAYEAFWFLNDHPKLRIRERSEVCADEAKELKKRGFIITMDKGGTFYREFRHCHRKAMDCNLDIFYHKNDDGSSECWLEFGQLEYGYMAGGVYDWDVNTSLQHFHDVDLDCGAETFDAALIILAKKVLKKYGGFRPVKFRDECGKPKCADCKKSQDVFKSIEVVPESPVKAAKPKKASS